LLRLFTNEVDIRKIFFSIMMLFLLIYTNKKASHFCKALNSIQFFSAKGVSIILNCPLENVGWTPQQKVSVKNYTV
jgi:hypothetical protein